MQAGVYSFLGGYGNNELGRYERFEPFSSIWDIYCNRSDPEFLYRVLEEVIKAGATTVNIPDTVGYNLPEEFGQLIAKIKANTPGADGIIISTHCHNDLGLATANTLAVRHVFQPF